MKTKWYNYPLNVPFYIVCQQEVNWICNYVPKAQQIPCNRGTRKTYILVSDSICIANSDKAIFLLKKKKTNKQTKQQVQDTFFLLALQWSIFVCVCWDDDDDDDVWFAIDNVLTMVY